MSNVLVNLFKQNATRLFGRFSIRYPHAADREFILMHDRHNLHFGSHVHGRIHF